MDEPIQKFADHTNGLLNEIKKAMKGQDKEAYKERSLANPNAFRELICTWCSMAVGHTVKIDDIDWSEFELFETVGRHFFLKLETEDNRGFKKNDFFDLFNMVYVSKRDKYYQLEHDWEDLIHESGLSHYLFRPRKVSA